MIVVAAKPYDGPFVGQRAFFVKGAACYGIDADLHEKICVASCDLLADALVCHDGSVGGDLVAVISYDDSVFHNIVVVFNT